MIRFRLESLLPLPFARPVHTSPAVASTPRKSASAAVAFFRPYFDPPPRRIHSFSQSCQPVIYSPRVVDTATATVVLPSLHFPTVSVMLWSSSSSLHPHLLSHSQTLRLVLRKPRRQKPDGLKHAREQADDRCHSRA